MRGMFLYFHKYFKNSYLPRQMLRVNGVNFSLMFYECYMILILILL